MYLVKKSPHRFLFDCFRLKKSLKINIQLHLLVINNLNEFELGLMDIMQESCFRLLRFVDLFVGLKYLIETALKSDVVLIDSFLFNY
jgi:hypothetical protein